MKFKEPSYGDIYDAYIDSQTRTYNKKTAQNNLDLAEARLLVYMGTRNQHECILLYLDALQKIVLGKCK